MLYLATVQTITGVVPRSTMVILDLVTLRMHTVEVITRTRTLIGVIIMDGTRVIAHCHLIIPCHYSICGKLDWGYTCKSK